MPWTCRWTRHPLRAGLPALLVLTIAGCAPTLPDPDFVGFACPEPCSLHATAWAGDTLLGDSGQPLIDQQGWDAPFAHLDHLQLGDAFIVNAEAPITALTEPHNDPPGWHYNAFPDAAQALARFGVDAIGLANNHVYDRGPAGLEDTVEHARDAGMVAFGAGLDAGQAAEPLIIETLHGRLAVLAFGRGFSSVPEAERTSPGALRYSAENLRAGHDLALERGADVVAAFVHWGANYSHVDRSQRSAAQRFVDAGYDLVVGHGSHMQQEIAFIGEVPILYSLGNFIFGTGGRFTEEFPGFGLVARTFLDGDGVRGIAVRCIATDNGDVRFQPRACDPADAEDVLQGLHPAIDVIDGEGWIGW